MAVADTVDPDGWMVTFNDLMGRIASRFGRIEPRRTATAYVRGLLSDLENKNCWNLAEHARLSGPQTMQRLLRTACWDADAVRDYVIEQLGPDGVLIMDETGFAATQPPSDQEHIPLTAPEIHRLLAALILTRCRATRQVLHWSQWRRRHQATARRCHYQRRSQP